MLYILLMILKVIGIVIGVIIGLLLLIVILALLVPIRYKASLVKNDEYLYEIVAKLKISWLLRIIYFRIKYVNGKFDYSFRIFGISIKKFINHFFDEKTDNKRDEKYININKDISSDKKCKIVYNNEQNENNNKNEHRSIENNNHINDEIIDAEDKLELIEGRLESSEDKFDSFEDNSEKEHNNSNSQERVSYINKIVSSFKSIIDGIKAIFEIPSIIRDIYVSLVSIVHKIKKNIQGAIDKFDKIKAFLFDEYTKRTFSLMKKYIIDNLNHIKPRKYSLNLVYGTGDPATTGQILAIIAATNGIHHDVVKIKPDFDKRVLEADMFIKGRIRIITILIFLLKIYNNKNIKMMLVKLDRLKEEF